MPALDLTYDDYTDGGKQPMSNSSNNNHHNPLYSNSDTKGRGFRRGGGGGRQKCPKCGTFVTFCHVEFEENTFYCAACSGWFLISPDVVDTTNIGTTTLGNISEPTIQKKRQNYTPSSSSPQILMEHVSTNYIHIYIYT